MNLKLERDKLKYFNIVFSGAQPRQNWNQFCLRMGTELVPETLYSNELTRLCAREVYIESCRRESFKTYKLKYCLSCNTTDQNYSSQ
jgi:hypothetical protein